MSFYTEAELQSFGFKFLGENVRLSTKASIYNASNISLGDNCRIDDFVVLSAGTGGIYIGSYVHVAVFSSLIGAGKILISDFGNISSRVAIYSSNDDYSGESMTNPCVPDKYKKVTHDDVNIGKHVIVGCGAVILPGTNLDEGVAIGALSILKGNYASWGIYAGSPAKFIKPRKQKVVELEQQFLADIQ